MAFDLNPVAVSAQPLLRAIAAGGWRTKSELAQQAGRLKNHIARDLGVLAEAGLIGSTEDPALTDAGRDQLAALDRAADPNAGGGQLSALHADLEPHPLNPRKDFESEEAQQGIDELRESAVTRTASGEMRGLMQPIVVRPRPEPGQWWIVDGERRYRAIAQAIWDGDWPEDRPLPIVVREVDDREHLMLSLTANLQRADMSAIEEAVAFHAAVNDFGVTTETLASELGKSQRYVQQRIALLKLDAADQDRMRLARDHPDHLTFKAARALTQTARQPSTNPWDTGGWVDHVIGLLATDYGAHLGERLPAWQLNDHYDGGLTAPEAAAKIAARHGLSLKVGEPGSPPAPATTNPADATSPAFGSTLSDREALLFVEIADKAERDRPEDEGLAAEGYTRIQNVPMQGAAASLMARGAIGVRQKGADVYVTPRMHSTHARAWLEEIGFYAHRDDVLFEMRVRVIGHDAADQARAEGLYATPWLNSPALAGEGASEVVEGAPPQPGSPNGPGWINGTSYERLFDRHNPERIASDFAPDLPWGEWLERPPTDFLDLDQLETWALPMGAHGFPTAQIQIAPILGRAGWMYAAGYSTGGLGHHESLTGASGRKEAFTDRETAVAAGVDLIRDSLGRMNRNRLPTRIYDWTVQMLDPVGRTGGIMGEPRPSHIEEGDQPELIETSEEERAAMAAGAQRAADRRADEMAVDDFAASLKFRLVQAREKDRRGWNDPSVCHVDDLARSLVEHVAKGDPLDIAAFAMFVLARAGSVQAARIIAEAHAIAHPVDAA